MCSVFFIHTNLPYLYGSHNRRPPCPRPSSAWLAAERLLLVYLPLSARRLTRCFVVYTTASMSTLKPSSWGVTALLVALLVMGCATSSPRPGAATAILGSQQIVVESIDERYVRDDSASPSRARFEIPPGRHAIEVSLEADSTALRLPADSAKTLTVCFDAVAGRSYLTQPIFEAGRWRAEVVDESTGAAVSSGCAEVQETTTEAQAPAMAPSPIWQETPRPASLPVPSRPLGRDSDLPGSGLTAGVGFFFGGESLYTVSFVEGPDRNLKAGRGVLVALGGLWTPWWIDDQFGFGAGASLGWKYDSIAASNGGVSLTRFPLSATVHSLIRLNKVWFTLLSGGLTKEVGGEVSGSGFASTASASFTSSLGLIGEGALYHRVGPATLGAALRYSRSHDWIQETKFDASSVGIIASVQYNF